MSLNLLDLDLPLRFNGGLTMISSSSSAVTASRVAAAVTRSCAQRCNGVRLLKGCWRKRGAPHRPWRWAEQVGPCTMPWAFILARQNSTRCSTEMLHVQERNTASPTSTGKAA